MAEIDPPPDDAALERLLRANRRGPPAPGDVTPWDFIRGWPDEYVVARVWPLVSRLLDDADAYVRVRCLEFVNGWSQGSQVAAPRLIDAVTRDPRLFGDDVVEGMTVRDQAILVLSNLAPWSDAPRIARAVAALAHDTPLDGGAATLVAMQDPSFAAEQARRFGVRALPGILAATDSIASLRRDDLLTYLGALRGLPAEAKTEVLATVEKSIHRDDAKAALATQTYRLPKPVRAAPSADECRRAIGL